MEVNNYRFYKLGIEEQLKNRFLKAKSFDDIKTIIYVFLVEETNWSLSLGQELVNALIPKTEELDNLHQRWFGNRPIRGLAGTGELDTLNRKLVNSPKL